MKKAQFNSRWMPYALLMPKMAITLWQLKQTVLAMLIVILVLNAVNINQTMEYVNHLIVITRKKTKKEACQWMICLLQSVKKNVQWAKHRLNMI